MKKIDRAVEIIRGWSDEELKRFIMSSSCCPNKYDRKNLFNKFPCDGVLDCEDCWNEEVEE
jgi:hypothetical protein